MEQLLTTKLFIPPTRPQLVHRPHLIERLNQGLHNKLTLISAPAGFGKTTLATEWLENMRGDAKNETQDKNKTAWLSLDEGDNDPMRFLSYFIAALNQTEGVDDTFGKGALSMLQSPQPPPAEALLTPLINEIATTPDRIIIVIDDYHVIESSQVDDVLIFLVENLPPQMHLVIATREDPHLPLPRLRARGQLTELRAIDLRLTHAEAAEFLNQVMGLDLSAEEIAALEKRTEGWITGLQLAAVALQGTISMGRCVDIAGFIKSFTGSHRYVLDYLIEEVLDQQSESVQTFLLKTAVLDRLTGPLCDALTDQEDSQQILKYLEDANLFILPLDNERHWYRYHHLFAELLRQRLHKGAASSTVHEVAELHIRASEWYEDNGLEIEAFQHAAAANDVERAKRLIEGEGVPFQYRGAAALVRFWLELLPTTELDARPSLWVTYASALNLTGQSPDAELKLQAAEAALLSKSQGAEPDDKTKDIIGHIAATRAMIAVGQHQLETIIVQSHRALEYLHPGNLPVRTITNWTLGLAYQLQGDRAAASRAYSDALSTSQASGDVISTLAATTGLGNIRESENQLYLAAESYRRGLQLFGDPPQPVACGVYLGLARIFYEWNDLDAAQQHGQLSLQLAQQVESIDTPALSWVILARLKLAQGDATGATDLLAQAEQFVHQHNFTHRIPDVAAAQVLTLLQQGDLAGAALLAEKHNLPISRTRVHLAQGETSTAVAILESERQNVEAKGWEDERVKVIVLQAVALYAHGEEEQAVATLCDALALAEPGDMIRTFVDEGLPMARLLHEVLSHAEILNLKIEPNYVQRLLAALPIDEPERPDSSKMQAPKSGLVESLSERELEVLQLIADGLTNQEIASRLFISLNTVKVHTRNIYGKLGAHHRADAVARGRALDFLPSN